MDRTELAAHIDHTVLGPTTTTADVERVLDEAREHGMNACIPPCYVEHAAEYASEVTLVTVVGFPHGQHAPDVKALEAEAVWETGADEIDVVANAGLLKADDDEAYRDELEEVVAAVPVPVKVIIETALLTGAEMHRACEAVRDAGANMVKTSTGFADTGARIADVDLMSGYLPVKAAGGIKNYAEAMELLEAGAERIGASAGVTILEGAPE